MDGLMWASVHGHEGAVLLPLEAGAAVELRDNTGTTAEGHARWKGNTGVVRIILEAVVAERRALAAIHARSRREVAAAAAVAAAEAVADALLAEEEAEKLSAVTRQSKSKRQKQSQRTKRAEAVPGPARAGASGPAPSGTDFCRASAPAVTAPESGSSEGALWELKGDIFCISPNWVRVYT